VEIAADSGDDTGPADAEQALSLVHQLGLFEDPSGQPAAWVERGEVEPPGQRVRGTLLWLWGGSLLLCAAGYFGWEQFVEHRHQAAASMVAQARALMSLGDHAALVDAERLLRMAREQHPASLAISEEALFVQLERVLEDGERDTAALRSAYARAHAAHVQGPSLALANLLLPVALTDAAGRDRALAEVLSQAKGDARTLYLLARAEERMGMDSALAHFEAAAGADAKLIPARLALAERAYERGERAAARSALDNAVAAAPNQLRVRLFRMLVAADDLEPDTLRQDLNLLAEPLRKGNSIDQALAALVRARLARRSASTPAAIKAIEAAAGSGVEDARVLGWLAEEALAIGNSLLAQQLASRALSVAPERVRSRRLLARILVERGAGQQAFVLLSSLPAADAEVQVWKARAALLSNDPELLRNALAALPAASGKKQDSDVQRAALRLRIETQLEPTKHVLERARSLAHAAPTDPDALLALAEAALAQRDAKLAQNALKQRALLLPEDVQAQTLLGRSLRMGADIDGAEAAFRRALTLRPGYVEAQTALAALLLDRGQFAQADAVYRELALHDETALSGRLGRVEALLGMGKLADAQVQLEAAPEAERATVAYREQAAKLALVRGEVAQALKLLGPLSEEQPKRALLRALYADALLVAAQLPAAGTELDAAQALDAELPEALLGRAELQLRSNKAKDALATLTKAEAALRDRLRPPALTARRLSLLGRTLLLRHKRGDAAAAVSALRAATDQAGAPVDSYFYLGEALSADKDKSGAQQAYRRYLELAPSGAYRQRAQRMLGAAR
jgi:predicted Zn-dependent protease